MALRRKLAAVDFPHTDGFDPNDAEGRRNLAIWLEDTKIRHYKIEDRTGLRSTDPTAWEAAFVKVRYVGSSFLLRWYSTDSLDAKDTSEEGKIVLLDWLLGYAVTLEYSDPDNIKEYTAAKPRGSAAAAAAPAGGGGAAAAAAAAGGGGAVVLDTASIRELAKILQLQEHPDDLVLLRAVTNAVRKKLKPSQDEPTETFPLANQPLGFDTGDALLNEAAKVLRLLHINELRDAQTQINELVVNVQALTADPKTNAKLGKVGR
eukprot:gene6682-6239_t